MAFDPFALSERLMRMDDAAWARHANPASVWSRFTILPLMTLAIFSRVWIGAWALIPVALVIAWTWINPRLFPPPDTTDSWAARGTFGERLFLDRARRDIPAHHLAGARILTAISALGILPWAWGLWQLQPWAAVAGLVLIMGGKAWYFDRMVWLHQDLSTEPPTSMDPSKPAP